jgi:hypothetical protein
LHLLLSLDARAPPGGCLGLIEKNSERKEWLSHHGKKATPSHALATVPLPDETVGALRVFFALF